jgi:cell division protein FtsB
MGFAVHLAMSLLLGLLCWIGGRTLETVEQLAASQARTGATVEALERRIDAVEAGTMPAATAAAIHAALRRDLDRLEGREAEDRSRLRDLERRLSAAPG